jgi:2-dehydro-3-deoxygluconokinase
LHRQLRGLEVRRNGQFDSGTVIRGEPNGFDDKTGGDSFVSGFICGLMEPGDTTMASLAEVQKIIAGASARVDR